MTVPTRDDLEKAINACRRDDPREDGIRLALLWAGGWTTYSLRRFIEIAIEMEREGYRCRGPGECLWCRNRLSEGAPSPDS